MQRLPERVMSLAGFQRNAAPPEERGGEMLGGDKKINKNPFIFSPASEKPQSYNTWCYAVIDATEKLLFALGTDFCISCLFYLSLGVHRTTAQLEVEIERDEEALAMLTIFANQYPFMLLLLVSGWSVSCSDPSFSLTPSLFFPPFSLAVTSCPYLLLI